MLGLRFLRCGDVAVLGLYPHSAGLVCVELESLGSPSWLPGEGLTAYITLFTMVTLVSLVEDANCVGK